MFMLMAFLTCQKSNISKLESKWWILIYFLSWQIMRNTVLECFPAVWSKGFPPRWDHDWGFQKCIINSKHFKEETKVLFFDRLVHGIFPLRAPILLPSEYYLSFPLLPMGNNTQLLIKLKLIKHFCVKCYVYRIKEKLEKTVDIAKYGVSKICLNTQKCLKYQIDLLPKFNI